MIADTNINLLIQKGVRRSEWFTAEDTSFINASIYFLGVDEVTMYTKDNIFGVIAIPLIETTYEKDYINMSYNLSKQYMYKYFVTKLISSKAVIQSII